MGVIKKLLIDLEIAEAELEELKQEYDSAKDEEEQEQLSDAIFDKMKEIESLREKLNIERRDENNND